MMHGNGDNNMTIATDDKTTAKNPSPSPKQVPQVHIERTHTDGKAGSTQVSQSKTVEYVSDIIVGCDVVNG